VTHNPFPNSTRSVEEKFDRRGFSAATNFLIPTNPAALGNRSMKGIIDFSELPTPCGGLMRPPSVAAVVKKSLSKK
jgi:hypothetical protein